MNRNSLPGRFARLIVTCCLALTCAADAATVPPSDVRIVVDVSGSMRDAADLRRDALERLIARVPAGSRAGIWTFGQHANMLVGHRQVDEQWRDDARAATRALTVAGLRTNLRVALEAAAWDAEVDSGRRDIVLVTDGRVDLSDDALVNDAERRALIQALLPKLARSRFTLHSLALSADADVAFLQQFAAATGGHAVRADDVAQIDVFIAQTMAPGRAEPATPKPVSESFVVRPGTTEVTLAILRQPGTAIELISPAQQRIKAALVSGYVRWRDADGDRTFVTLSNPASGRWLVEPAPRRMTILDDLAAHVGPVQSSTDTPRLEAYLTQADARIEAPLFDGVVVMKAERVLDNATTPLRARPNSPASSVYAIEVPAEDIASSARVRVHVFGPTFERAAEFGYVQATPIVIHLDPGHADDATAHVDVSIPSIDTSSLRILAALTSADGRTKLVGATKAGTRRWSASIPGVSDSVEITLKLSGKYLDKKELSLTTEAFAVALPMTRPVTERFDAKGRRVNGAGKEPTPDHARDPVSATGAEAPVPVAEPAPVSDIENDSAATSKAEAVVATPVVEAGSIDSAGTAVGSRAVPRALNQWDAIGLGALGGLNLLAFLWFAFRTFERRRRAANEVEDAPATSLEPLLEAHRAALARANEKLDTAQAA